MRYLRNINVIGEEGQTCLHSSSVMIVGCGALGGQVAMLLAGAGIGRIGIADFDVIEISNLQRQLFFSESSSGQLKAQVLAKRMNDLNSDINVEIYPEKISEKNAENIFRNYNVIIDATDKPGPKYLIAGISQKLRLPCIIGGVEGWKGQVIALSDLEPDAP
ncbi:MAG: HesA/MoeB/ThiF family protein, partial [Muribaculaceae bacterium]|nr:HesA/MoeB/ThiF family protein [Muribaculaceae bacterium]